MLEAMVNLVFPLPCPQSRDRILRRKPLEGRHESNVVGGMCCYQIAVQGSNTVTCCVRKSTLQRSKYGGGHIYKHTTSEPDFSTG